MVHVPSDLTPVRVDTIDALDFGPIFLNLRSVDSFADDRHGAEMACRNGFFDVHNALCYPGTVISTEGQGAIR